MGRRVQGQRRRRQGVLLISTRLAAVLAAAALFAPAAASGGAPTIRVTLTDTVVQVSRETAVAGTLRFAVVNRGRRAHGFSIGGHRTRTLAPGGRATLVVAFPKAGTFVYRSGSFAAAFTIEPKPAAATAKAPPGCPARPTVTVVIQNGRFQLSQQSVPCGIVTFVITNQGDSDGEDELDGFVLSAPGGVGPSLRRGETGKLVVGLAPGRYSYTAGNYENTYEGEYGTLVVTG